MVDGWFLREGLAVTSKQESRRTWRRSKRDPALAALLHQAIPVTLQSAAWLLRAADHVFGRTGE